MVYNLAISIYVYFVHRLYYLGIATSRTALEAGHNFEKDMSKAWLLLVAKFPE